MKLPLGAYSTETSAAVGAWVLLERNDKKQTEGAVGGGGQNSQLGDSEAGGKKPAVSCRGRALTPNVRNVGYVDYVAVLATYSMCTAVPQQRRRRWSRWTMMPEVQKSIVSTEYLVSY